MAVEKVAMVSVVGSLKDVESFCKDIYLFEDIELMNTMAEVESGRFTLPVDENNIEELLGFANLKPGSDNAQRKRFKKELDRLTSFYSKKLVYKPEEIRDIRLDPEEVLKEADAFNSRLEEKFNRLTFARQQLDETNESIMAYSFLQEIDVPMRELYELKNFKFSLGSVTADNASRLKLIYPSIPSVVLHVGDTTENEKVYFVVTANDFQAETDRVLKALDFKPLVGLNSAYQGTPKEIITLLTQKKEALEAEIERLEGLQNGDLIKTRKQAERLYNQLQMLVTVETIKSFMAFSNENFYFSGWIPVRVQSDFTKITNQYPGMIVVYEKPTKGLTPPTKLLNNWVFRPFEQLVKMYGIPNYHELDPTPFFAITYILFFGYMFGDVGQGLVLLLGGLYLEHRGFGLGGVAARVACASIVFGFLYGSVFGIETIIPALWIRPMENTTLLLVTAVVVGVVMLIIAYVYSLIDKHREHEVEQEYFGKNGISGFAIYLLVLIVGLMLFNYLPDEMIVRDILIAVIVVLTFFVLLELPLANLIEHKRFSQNVQGEYYVSSFFEAFEMYLSMLSNTLSFIRVGAFALTHVGMFMAFETMADLAGGGLTGVVILVIGNIFILVLEGLIDFIQCLRLEFYELFGKYYEGDGVEFQPVQQTVSELQQ